MLAASSASAIVMIKFYQIEIHSYADQTIPPERQLQEYNIAQGLLSRLNVSSISACRFGRLFFDVYYLFLGYLVSSQ